MVDTYLVEGFDLKRIVYSGTVEADSDSEAISKAKTDYLESQGGGDPATLLWRVTTSNRIENEIHKSKPKVPETLISIA